MDEFREMCSDITRSMWDRLASKGLANVSGYWSGGILQPQWFDTPAYVVPLYVEPGRVLGHKYDHDYGSVRDWIFETMYNLGVQDFDWFEFNNRFRKLLADRRAAGAPNYIANYCYGTHGLTRAAAMKVAATMLPNMVDNHIRRLEAANMRAKVILEPTTKLTGCDDLIFSGATVVVRRRVTVDRPDGSIDYDRRLGDPAKQVNCPLEMLG